MRLGVVADVHGNFTALTHAMTRHDDVPFWLCVGDLASDDGAYPEPPSPLFWIKGNNENFDRIAEWEAGAAEPRGLHYIRNGTACSVGTLRVTALGGTYAPTWFETPASALPHTPRDDKRRHFVRNEVDACARLAPIDILLTHEAPQPFILTDASTPGTRARRRDAGKRPINDLIVALAPRLHLCGHHHRFVESVRDGVPSICLDRVERSYLLLDARTLEWTRVDNAV